MFMPVFVTDTKIIFGLRSKWITEQIRDQNSIN